MKYPLFLCFIVLLSVSCVMDKTDPRLDSPKHSIVLLANNGFNDTSGSGSFANVSHTSSLTHSNVNAGEFHCYFLDSIYYHRNPDSAYNPQLSIVFANLRQEMFTATIYFTSVNLTGKDSAILVCAKNDDNGKRDTSRIFIDSTSRFIKLDSLTPSSTHIYYLNVFGLFKNTNLWFEASKIEVDYLDSIAK
jgi:hypothetical protein